MTCKKCKKLEKEVIKQHTRALEAEYWLERLEKSLREKEKIMNELTDICAKQAVRIEELKHEK